MRKDFTIDTGDADTSEIAFVEDYWTQKWVEQGGPKDRTSRIPRKEEFRVMRPYLEKLPKGARMLDGGCGLGDWTVYFTEQGWPTLGLDISRDTVAKLREFFPEHEFEVGDIRQTGLPDASFDAYFSWGTFEHFEAGLEPCIDEAYRVLKPGGLLFTSVPFDNLRHALRAAGDWKRKAQPAAGNERFYQWRLTRGEFRGLLAKSGFEVLDVKAIGKRQGVLRSLQHEFGLPYQWFVSRAASAAVAPFVPSGLVAHMLLAVARKPETDPPR
ncbi:MAG: class I SAM-dependent methyltransferase [Alphaproteobacteria bacterium]|nr:class I SAM-dependent methyltransferase [Alphaproteobacteria bacterium]